MRGTGAHGERRFCFWLVDLLYSAALQVLIDVGRAETELATDAVEGDGTSIDEAINRRERYLENRRQFSWCKENVIHRMDGLGAKSARTRLPTSCPPGYVT